jgi:hypothetical protein
LPKLTRILRLTWQALLWLPQAPSLLFQLGVDVGVTDFITFMPDADEADDNG